MACWLGVLGLYAALSGRGEIGRHAGFRYLWRKPWGFKSLRPHQILKYMLASVGFFSITFTTTHYFNWEIHAGY
jgi:hypothetical protein